MNKPRTKIRRAPHQRSEKAAGAISDESRLDDRGATPERIGHAQGHFEVGRDARGREAGLRTMRDTVLDRAHRKGIVGEKQYTAAIKFLTHWQSSGLNGGLSSVDLNAIYAQDIANYSHMAKTEAQAWHRARYREAVRHIGMAQAAVAEAVICYDHAIADAGYKLGWRTRPQAYAAAVERLRGALDQLIRLWGL